MKTIEVSVTAEHIAEGKRNDCSRCPIALALSRIVPPEGRVYVYSDHAVFSILGKGPYFGDLPDDAQYFVQMYDKARSVGPFTFTMQIPEEVTAR